MFFNHKKKTGFTLIELMVVIAILGIISSLVLSSISSARRTSHDTKRVADLKEVSKALAFFYDVNGTYPYRFSQELELNWGVMLDDLAAAGFISSADFYDNPSSAQAPKGISFLVRKAESAMPPPADPFGDYNTEIQDPLYPSQSYGYMVSPDGDNYRLRAKLENQDSAYFDNSLEGYFLFPFFATGDTACDKSLNYYCIGPAGNFEPRYVGPFY
ncbi:MAG: prepilin-type N-terminal cleavage/methylation domain-containing protein [Candidatus Pacebacteria bacterium]|nr:prepilin-type N-terminal cleavage/methylation domain-containing protein [Candidatus Paceibacterota bacterium]